MKKVFFQNMLYMLTIIGLSLSTEAQIFCKKFGAPIIDSKIMIPKDFTFDDAITEFRQKFKNQEPTSVISFGLIDSSFTGKKTMLEPGKVYKYKVFPILKHVTKDEIIKFIIQQRAIVVGCQGLILMEKLKKSEFLDKMFLISFDSNGYLWKDEEGDLRIPVATLNSDLEWKYGLWLESCEFGNDCCLLCFYIIDKKE